MGSFFIEYRDPLFGIIILLAAIFLISAISAIWRIYSTKKSEKNLKKFVKRFDIYGADEEVLWLVQNSKEPVPPLKMLASIYTKSGDLQKAIKIYVTILETIPLSKERIEIMELLGVAYFKGGFLQRARDIFLQQLKHYPRNSVALTHLMYVYESLGEYASALEVLNSLEELEGDVGREKGFFNIRSTIQSQSLKLDKKCAILQEFEKIYPFAFRQIAEFYAHHAKKIFWAKIDNTNAKLLLDIFWGMQKSDIDMEVVQKIPLLKALFSAKGYINESIKSGIFEIDSVVTINRFGETKADIGFEYICNNCKYIYPLYVSRCQNCQTLLEVEPIPIIIQKERNIEERDSLY